MLLTAGSPPNVSASVVYHGSLLMLADIQAINAPISFQQSDPALDNNFNTTFYNQVRDSQQLLILSVAISSV